MSIKIGIIILILLLTTILFVFYLFKIQERHVEKVIFAERRIFNISSDWYYTVFSGDGFQDSPPSKGWINTDLPKLIYSSGYRGAWFKKKLFIPRLNGSGSIFLVFYGVRYKCKIFVNDRYVFTHFSGFTPFKVDITNYVKQGDVNEIYLCIFDWTSMLNEKINLSRLERTERPVDRAKNAILYPIGSKYTYFGIGDDVELWIVPSIWVKDVFVKTFYRNSTVMVEALIENNYFKDIEVTVVNRILDDGREILTLPVKRVQIKSGESVKITTYSVWNKCKLWSPWNPYLYNLSTTIIVDNKKIDEKLTEFGFREFWVENGSYYLNGIKIILRVASTHFLDYNRQKIVETYYILKNISVNSMRLHAQPWRRMWYTLADKMGMLIIHESAIWCLGRNYRVSDPVFWENFIKHLEGQILLHRNHPSIIIWSIENELLLTGGYRDRKSLAETEKNLAKLANIVRSLDPTRPIMFEGDFDPNGVADIINLHYPHEFPKHDQYPNTVFWLLNETLLDSYPRIRWRWDRSKPLHIGEFLWMPFTSYDIPATIFGEEAYKDPYEYYLRIKMYVWRYQIMGYRILRVNGFCPWCVFTSGRLSKQLCKVIEDTYKPIIVFPLNFDNAFFEDIFVKRKIAVINDHYRSVNLTLKCIFKYRDISNTIYMEKVELEPAEVKILEYRLKTPKISSLKEKAWIQISLFNESKEIFNKNISIYIYSKSIVCNKNILIFLMGDDSDTERALKSLGITYVKTNKPEKGFLLIAKDALENIDWRSLLNFAENGGIILILEQKNISSNPLGVELTKHSTTIAIPITLDYPIFNNLDFEDFRYWRDDHIVSYADLNIPLFGAAFPVISSGIGLQYSQLLEIRYGRGLIIFSQLALISKFDIEPRARLILKNLIEYYLNYTLSQINVGILQKSSNLIRILNFMDADFDETGLEDLEKYDLILLSASTLNDKDVSILKNFCKKGGILYIYNVNENSINFIENLIEIDLDLVKSYPSAIFTDNSIVKLIGNNLLYWIREGRMWRRGPPNLDNSLTEKIIMEKVNIPNPTKLNLSRFNIVDGKLIYISKDSISMYGNGRISTTIYLNNTGYYSFMFEANGTCLENTYPLMEILIDGERKMVVEVSQYNNYSYTTYLEKGVHSISIAFINDRWIPGIGDINLFVYNVAYGLIDKPKVIPLTNPSILVKIPLGKGYVLIDQVPWIQKIMKMDRLNYFKALKYGYLLLSSIGVKFGSINTTLLKPLNFKSASDCYKISSEIISMYSNGYVYSDVKIFEDGYYKFIIIARGDKARGDYPIAQLYLNQTLIGEIRIKSSLWQEYIFITYVKRGTYRLKIYFTNDYWNPPNEDRNLYIKLVFIKKIVKKYY